MRDGLDGGERTGVTDVLKVGGAWPVGKRGGRLMCWEEGLVA